MGSIAADTVAEVMDAETLLVVAGVGVPAATDLLFDGFVSVGFPEWTFPGWFGGKAGSSRGRSMRGGGQRRRGLESGG